jgi:hypothetical protein
VVDLPEVITRRFDLTALGVLADALAPAIGAEEASR